jgi:hypothetical protein
MNRTGTRWVGGILACALLGLSSMAQARQEPKEKPLIEMSFDEINDGWQSLGAKATATITTEAGKAKLGKGALAFEYGVQKGELNALFLPVSPGTLSKMQSVRFWIKSDYATSMAVTLQEKEGGRFIALFSVPANQWQKVELALDDFALSDGATDPADANGKLDVDKIEAVAISDFAQFFAQADDPNLIKLFSVKTGTHTLWLDQFTMLAEPLTQPAPEKNITLLDAFTRPQVSWLGVGDVQLSQTSGKPLTGTGLKAAYKTGPGKISAWVRRVAPGKFTGKEQLAMTIASDKPTRIVIQLEEIGGGKYNAILDLPGGGEAKEYSFKFAEFTRADDSRDDNTQLDLERVHQMVCIDLTGLLESVEQEVTLWMNRVRVIGSK